MIFKAGELGIGLSKVNTVIGEEVVVSPVPPVKLLRVLPESTELLLPAVPLVLAYKFNVVVELLALISWIEALYGTKEELLLIAKTKAVVELVALDPERTYM